MCARYPDPRNTNVYDLYDLRGNPQFRFTADASGRLYVTSFLINKTYAVVNRGSVIDAIQQTVAQEVARVAATQPPASAPGGFVIGGDTTRTVTLAPLADYQLPAGFSPRLEYVHRGAEEGVDLPKGEGDRRDDGRPEQRTTSGPTS